VGGVGKDTLAGAAGSDVIKGGVDSDRLTGGAGRDTFAFAAGDSGQGALTLDVITDFTKGALNVGDLIDYSASLTIGGSNAITTDTEASISITTGITTFKTGSGVTLSDALSDIATRFTASTDSAGEIAFFKVNNSGNFYAFISDGTNGVTANDVVIQLTGLTSIKAIDLTGGNLTILS
jgi:Ca2+-binding RTX toxin-like protein